MLSVKSADLGKIEWFNATCKRYLQVGQFSLNGVCKMSQAMQIFEATHGKKLAICDRIKVDPANEYYNDWGGEYVVTGITWERKPDFFNVTIAEPGCLNDGGSDGWELDDLILVNTK